ncbi:MAG: hypothetical protein AAGA75_09960 [Cyanobacteria bacterium P01_E01_bin.6]
MKIADIISVTPIPIVSTVAKVASVGFRLFDEERVQEISAIPQKDILESGKTASAWFERLHGLIKERNIDDSDLMSLLRSVAVHYLATKIINNNDELSVADLSILEEELYQAPEAAVIISQEPDLATNESELRNRFDNIRDLLDKLEESVGKTWDELYIQQLNRQEELLQIINDRDS